MGIDLPSDGDSSNDDSVFGGRIDLYESYWLYVDAVRYVGSALRESEATKEDEEFSQLARHYNHFYEKKNGHKKKCQKLPGNLPKYKDHFQEPRGDARRVSENDLHNQGIFLEEGDDPIWLPTEYELPPVWENDLENMGVAELRDLVRSLREENNKIRNERDDLEEKLAAIGSKLSNYLENDQSIKNEETDSTDSKMCEKCGETFDTISGKHGHKPHCDGANQNKNNVFQTESNSDKNLEELAEGLSKIWEEQSNEVNKNISSEEDERESLNHLLGGHL